MNRSVPVWLWIFSQRKNSPGDSSVRHVLKSLGGFINPKTGVAFPSQKAIAEDTGLSMPTVRRALELAWRRRWIGVALHGEVGKGGGKNWRSYEYRACIPDSVLISAGHEKELTEWRAKHPDIDTDQHPDISKLVGKPVTQHNAMVGKQLTQHKPDAGKDDTPLLGKSSAHGGKNDPLLLGKPFTPNSSSENSSLNFSCNSSGEEAETRAGIAEKPKDPEAEWLRKQQLIRKAREDDPHASVYMIANHTLRGQGISVAMVKKCESEDRQKANGALH